MNGETQQLCKTHFFRKLKSKASNLSCRSSLHIGSNIDSCEDSDKGLGVVKMFYFLVLLYSIMSSSEMTRFCWLMVRLLQKIIEEVVGLSC